VGDRVPQGACICAEIQHPHHRHGKQSGSGERKIRFMNQVSQESFIKSGEPRVIFINQVSQ